MRTRLFAARMTLLSRTLWTVMIGTLLAASPDARASACVPPPANLAAWWPGDGTTKEIVGGNDGTILGSAAYADGYVGKTCSTDGEGGYVLRPTPLARMASVYARALSPTEVQSIYQEESAGKFADQRQVTALNVRFVDNGDGTISDNETGLMWEKRARDGSLHDVGTVWQTWSSSGTAPDGTIWTRFIGGLNAGDGFAGHKDWRIPNLTELQGILDNSLPPPKMPPVFNNGCVDGCTVTTCSCPHGGFVWTATPAENNSSYAWVVFFNEGRSLTEGKWNGAAVRAVRTMAVPVESGVVAYYPFSGDATDASGHGNDGTSTTPSLTADRFGSPGQAYNFKADVGSYIRVPNSSSLELPGDFSVSLWVKFNQGWGYHTEALIWKLSGTPPSGTTGWHFGLNEDSGYTAGFLLMNPGIHLAASQGIDFERDWLGRWNHVVGVRSAGQLNFFVNGSLLASAADGGLSVSSAGDLIIGGSSHPVSGAYDRDIDDIRIYDRALTSTQVAQLFALESASAACGNSVLESGEECDDGNTANGDGCDSNCTITGCGNGVRTNGEHCDDGNLANGDGCNSTCQLETRFIDNGDGTISDTQTNLMWEKKSHDGSLHDYGTGWRTWSSSGTAPDGTMWTQFLSGLNQGAGFAGYIDWRIPELAELQGIRDGTLPPPGMDPVFNQGCTAGCTVLTCSCPHGGFVWSATTYADNPSYAWVVFFNENRALPEGKWNGAVIRAVRTITSTPPAAECADGVLESDEECDDGNTASGDCCSSTCRYESAGTVCRTAQGVCDVEERCTGSSATCPTDAFLPTGTVCRGVAGVCDVAENCTGTAAACPADTKAANTTVCRTSGSACDPAETCDGFGDSCPPDDACEAPTTPVLKTHRIYYRTRPVAGDLWGYGLNSAEDYRTLWQKAISVNPIAPSGFGDFEMNVWNQNNPGGEHGNLFYYIRVEFELTATADLAVNPYPDFGWGGAVFLDGQPVSVSVSDLPSVGSLAFSRRLNAGFHVLEEYGGDYCCDGWNSGSYTLNGGTVPPYGGAIFFVERCGNGVVEAGEQCDLGYLTNGEFPSCCTAACGFASEATNCRDQRGSCDTQEYCTGTSATCPDDRVASSAVICRLSAGICDPSEYCTGADDGCPADAVEPSTTVCRASAGVCDLVENCMGSSATCPTDTFAAATVTCREPGGVCDVAETCTGSTVSCPVDTKRTSVCRASAGVCDTTESCDGIGENCPADAFVPSTTTCRSSAGFCDVAETCNGSSATCPADVKSSAQCRASIGPCDSAEICDGVSNACPVDVLRPSGALCREEAAECDAPEFCNGISSICPTDQRDTAGTSCTDDGNLCSDDQCDGLGSCAHQPIPLAPLCDWVAIGGSDTVRSSIRTRYRAQISGNMCADRGDIGESTGIFVVPGTPSSSLAFLEDSGTAVKVRPKAALTNGRVVTGGGCVTGLELAEIFGTSTEPLCCENSPRALPGGIEGNVIDACGLDPLLEACSASKAQVSEDVATLDALTATQRLGTVAVAGAGSYTILLQVGLNVIDMDRLRMDQSSTLTFDAQGNVGAVAILRLAKGMSTKVKATIRLEGGASAEHTLIYAAGGNCSVGWNNSGTGSLFCPEGKIRMGVDSEWFGSVAAGGIDIGWGTRLTHVPFVGLSHGVLELH